VGPERAESQDVEWIVREAETGDAPDILRIHRAVLDERDYFITLPHEFSVTIFQVVQKIRDLARQENSLFLVVCNAAKTVGFLTIQGGPLERLRHTGKLEVMIDKGARGMGVGRLLMHASIEWARQNPALEKLGLSVFTGNSRAVMLYRQLGFEEEGCRRREYRMSDGTYRDDLLMYLFVDGSDPE